MSAQSFDLKVAKNGRVVLPRAARVALGVQGEGKVTLTIDDDGVALHSLAAHVRRAQEAFRKYAKDATSVDDFLAERKAEGDRRDDVLAGGTGDR